MPVLKLLYTLCSSLRSLRVLCGKIGLIPASNLLLVFIVTCFTYCQESPKQAEAIIINEHIFDSIPSGSGLALHHDSIFIVGDDAPFLYQLSLKTNLYRTIPISFSPTIGYRIHTDEKPDYEAAANVNLDGKNYLFLFGSGSKSPQRDSLLIVPADRLMIDTIVSVKRFYDHLKKITRTADKDWNLEGATIVKDKIILFNRGNNLVISFNIEEFLAYALTTGRAPPPIKHFTAVLPAIEGYQARLSGAATMDNQVLFCASVEKTEDWTRDGPILGSYTGILDLEKQQLTLAALVRYVDGKPCKEKLESVVLLRKAADRDITLLAVADNDDGKSRLMQIRLQETGH